MSSIAEATKERFNQEAREYDTPERIRTSEKAAKAIDEFVGGLKPDQDVLDIGCGTGLLTTLIAPKVRSVVGVDTSEGMISVLNDKRENHPNIKGKELLLTDPETQLEQDERFDLVISSLVLHHVPDIKEMFEVAFKALKSKGVIAMSDYEDFGKDALLFHPESKRPTCEFPYGIKKVDAQKALEEAGFINVRVFETFFETKKVVERDEPMSFPFILCTGTKP